MAPGGFNWWLMYFLIIEKNKKQIYHEKFKWNKLKKKRKYLNQDQQKHHENDKFENYRCNFWEGCVHYERN
jgi:hypothetical protein